MAHVHHSHQGADLVEAAKSTMERSGEQWTQMRAAVFDALASFDKPASAYDIAERVSQNEGRRVAANSVYRILDLFVGANVNFMLAFNLLDPRPVFVDYARRTTDRPAYHRAREIDSKLIAEAQAQIPQPQPAQ